MDVTRSTTQALLLALLLHLSHAASHAATPGCFSDAGGPSCGVTYDVGSSEQSWLPPHHVGNPVDVISGNKYQRELDYQAFGTPLGFTRHYNSTLTNHDLRLGHGWRHSYHVVLSRIDEQTLQIVQSDGRRIEFRREAEGVRYLPKTPGDGFLLESEERSWHLPDGRKMVFAGSWLVRIEFAEARFNLELFYERQRLTRIADSFGRTLELTYTQGELTDLPEYGNDVGTNPGHLESLRLPDGSTIRYTYDKAGNATAVVYPEGDKTTYQYHEPDFLHHLTARSFDGVTKNWAYDYLGRVRLHEAGVGGEPLMFGYQNDDEFASEGATLVQAGELRQLFSWKQSNATGERHLQSVREQACIDCEERLIEFNRPSTAEADIETQTASSAVSQGQQPDLSIMQRHRVTSEISAEYTMTDAVANKATVLQPDGSTVEIATDRLGKILDLQSEGVSMHQLAEQVTAGSPGACEDDSAGCIADLIDLYDMSLDVQSGVVNPAIQPRSAALSGSTGACAMPPGMTCAQLEREFELAQLSQCVYGDPACSTPGWSEVKPADIGLTDIAFNDGAFSAKLYKNDTTQEYVLAFAGSATPADFWEDMLQYSGVATKQYRLARNLSASVAKALNGKKLSYTGHSLGGGLATVGSLTTGHQSTVFNSAALHPKTAKKLSLNINNANGLVRNVVVENEIVTWLQSQPVCPVISTGNKCIDSHGRTLQKEVYKAPGQHVTLPMPAYPWRRKQRDNTMWRESVVLHYMSAVLESSQELLAGSCGVSSTYYGDI